METSSRFLTSSDIHECAASEQWSIHFRGGHMAADPRALPELLDESQDLQADALRPTYEALDELVESAHAQRADDAAANQAFHDTHTKALTSSLAATALLGAAGGAVLVGALASAAAASSTSDVQILQ